MMNCAQIATWEKNRVWRMTSDALGINRRLMNSIQDVAPKQFQIPLDHDKTGRNRAARKEVDGRQGMLGSKKYMQS